MLDRIERYQKKKEDRTYMFYGGSTLNTQSKRTAMIIAKCKKPLQMF